MKSMKKLVLAALILLASVVGLLSMAGCKNDSVPEVPKYTVTFDKNAEDATGEMAPQTFTQGEKKELTANAFVRPTWTFSGWSEKKDATTPEYKDKAEFTTSKDTTLYAVWTDNGTVSPVTFDPSSTKFYYGETVTVTLATATEDATIKYRLADSEDWKIYNEAITITSDTTITAYATKAGLKDSAAPTATYTVRKLTKISITPPTRTVYSVGESFDGSDMVVTATYEDGETREVTGWTTNFSDVTSEKGVNKKVTVSYTEGDNKKTATFTVDVVDPSDPTKLTSYISPNHTDDPWTYMAFGEWPQTKANVEGISLQQVVGGRGYFKDNYYTDGKGNYYVKVTANPLFNTYKYSDNSGVTEGSEVYFKVEPIVWRVLTEDYEVLGEDGELQKNALLLAENILTGDIPYYVDGNKRNNPDIIFVSPNNYQYSTIRAWLNGKYEDDDTQEKSYTNTGFLQTAFTPEAQVLITPTTVDNSARSTNPDSNDKAFNSGENQYARETKTKTKDKIFLLSVQEATKEAYGFAVYDAYGEGNTRIRVTTDYAKATGAYQDSSGGYGGRWWLRSPDSGNGSNARYISPEGNASLYSGDVDRTFVGVVPALSISINGN